MLARPSAVVFSGKNGLGHVIYADFGSDSETTARESWLVSSAGPSNGELEPVVASQITDPVYQEIVQHELAEEPGSGLCALLTGSCFNHHFSAVFSLHRDLETPEWTVLEVDIADRCRGPVEKLAATYFVSGEAARTRASRSTNGSVAWEGVDLRRGLLELIAHTPATVEVSRSSSARDRVEIRAKIDPETHTQRLRYRWRWTSSSDLTR
jgi:hypothetical protein